METGQVVEIIGAVIDVKFPRESMPKVYDALKVDESNLTLEVQQQIGDGIVRTIAMGSTDGLKRGLSVNNTGAPINVPVGEKTLGRIMNVLGEPVDNAGEIKTEKTMPIHRPAPTFSEQASEVEILETGIKVVDLICPFAKGSKVGLFGGAGVGKTVILMELIRNIAAAIFLINSIKITVLPTPAPPNKPTLLPFANGQIKSTTLMPVSRISTSDACSEKVGAGLCIGMVFSVLISPALSTGSPRTFIILPRVFSPTGTFIGAPVLFTESPLFKPSVEPIAIVLTIPSPICC